MKFTPTDEQWEKMKKHIKSDRYKKEDFFVFETLAVGDRIVPNRYTRLMPDLLDTMKEDAQKGVSLMLNHNWAQAGVQSIPIGKVFDARIDASSQSGETTTLYTTQYILKDDSKVDGYSKNDIINLIESGILSDTSIGWGTTTEAYKCSICGNSIYDYSKCDHIPGRKYIVNEETNEVKQCIIEAHSPAEKHDGNNVLMENSIVFDGAYPNAIIQSSFNNVDNKSEILKPLEGKQELSKTDMVFGYTTNGNINLFYKTSFEKGGNEAMDNVEENIVEETPVDNATENTAEVEENTAENAAENTQENVDNVDNSVENSTEEVVENSETNVEEPEAVENTETMFTEKEILEKFDSISDNLEELIMFAKEGKEARKEVIEQALNSGVRALGNSFNKEVFAITFSKMKISDIKNMAQAYETQVSEKFNTERVSHEKTNKVENVNEYKNLDFNTFKTGIY